MVIDSRALEGAPGSERALRLYLTAVAGLSREQVVALGDAVATLVAEGADRERTSKGYLFAWFTGPRISDEESRSFGAYFQEVVAALALAASGTDPHVLVPDRPPQAGLVESLKELFLPYQERNELGTFAIRILEKAVSPADVRPMIVAAWNAGSAIWMRGRIAPEVEATLTAPWRRAIGDLPA